MDRAVSPAAAPLPGVLDVAQLAREIAARIAPDSLLDAADAAAMIGCTPSYFADNFARAPGFPKPVRLTGLKGRKGQPRWRRQDLTAWIDSHVGGKSKVGGRPRNNDD